MTGWAKKRFWTEATVAKAEGGYQVLLDGKPLRTPAKAALVLPTEALAQAVAAEWQAQEGKINPATMPFTRSANAAIDKVAPQFDEVADLVAAYGGSDLLCYRAEGPEALVARQAEAWDPLLDWAKTALEAPLVVTAGIVPIAQPAESLAALRAEVGALTAFELTGFHDLVSLSGSLVIGFAALRGYIPSYRLWEISRIDETWQAEFWGEDEEAVATATLKRAAFLHADEFCKIGTIRP